MRWVCCSHWACKKHRRRDASCGIEGTSNRDPEHIDGATDALAQLRHRRFCRHSHCAVFTERVFASSIFSWLLLFSDCGFTEHPRCQRRLALRKRSLRADTWLPAHDRHSAPPPSCRNQQLMHTLLGDLPRRRVAPTPEQLECA